MRKSIMDPKVKKTMLRNYEMKFNKSKSSKDVILDSKEIEHPFQIKKIDQQSNLNQPSTCSSEVLANYLSKAKKDIPIQIDNPVDSAQLGVKITKKLNFHINDSIYKNLVELNAETANVHSKKDKRVSKTATSIKKDVEPKIEDFCCVDRDDDIYPDFPVLKPKLKGNVEYDSKDLHNLVAAFENL